jgi:hypothetical protein
MAEGKKSCRKGCILIPLVTKDLCIQQDLSIVHDFYLPKRLYVAMSCLVCLFVCDERPEQFGITKFKIHSGSFFLDDCLVLMSCLVCSEGALVFFLCLK